MELALGCTTRPYNFLPFAEACRRIADAGYREVAVFANSVGGDRKDVAVRSDSGAAEVAEARKAAEDVGLTASMLLRRIALDRDVAARAEEYARLIDNAVALGARWILDCGVGDRGMFDTYVEIMRRAAPHAAEAGVGITLKPHGGITLTVQDLVRAHEAVGHPAFGICYDPGNILFYTKGEVRPETDLDRVAPRVTTGIIKDCSVVDGKPNVAVTPGEGLVDFPAVLSGLAAGGFRGPLYLECVGGTEPDEIDRNVRRAREFVREVLAGL